MRLYRVFPWVRKAQPGEPGHALYIASRNSVGRLDNPGHYRVLYAANKAIAAVAEAFGSFELWTAGMLAGSPTLPGSRRAIAAYEIPDTVKILDLDDGSALARRKLRPSQVVTRDRGITQAWALRIFQAGGFAGVKWWSYYNPDWGAAGLWDITNVDVLSVAELTVDSDVLEEARAALMRSWVG